VFLKALKKEMSSALLPITKGLGITHNRKEV
jgi:hypothetical protein